ncbi:NUDIX domain-containing protein [Nocardia takedensis]|uniref:NUDIX domain-containing protein n=1 Tax=Nocardia takedensis TaxID=259390 RepID=UPI003F769A2E
MIAGAIREAREEVGVVITPAELTFVHVVHHRSPEMVARVGFFFLADVWDGEPTNREPLKCAGLLWADPADPPPTTVPYSAAALHQIAQGHQFSLDGWEESAENTEVSSTG